MSRDDKSLKEMILDSIGHAVVAIDQEGKILYWNQTAEKLYGWTSEEVIGKAAATYLLSPAEKQATESLSKSLREGIHYQGEFQVKRVDGMTMPIWISVSPIIDEDAEQIAMVGVANDLRMQKKAERRLSLLSEINQLLNTTLVTHEVLERISTLLVPEFADWFVLDLLNESGQLEIPVVMHKDPEKIKWGLQLRQENPVDMAATTGLAKVIKTGEAEFYPDITDEMLVTAAKNEEHLDLLRAIGNSSALIVPLETPQAVTGALTLVSTESDRKFSLEDLSFAREIASRAAIALENARLYEGQKAFADQLEQLVNKRTEQVRELAAQLTLTEQKERQALATTLHDTVQQELYALRFALTSTKRKLNDTESLASLEEAEALLQQTIATTRNVTKDLGPQILEDIDLCKAFTWLAENMQERYGLEVVQSGLESCEIESQAVRTLIFNLVRELLFNVVKHAEVKQAQLEIDLTAKYLSIHVKDTGKGFNAKPQEDPGTGLGLAGAHKRLSLFGGSLSIKSNSQEGTCVSIQIPMSAFSLGRL